MGAGHADEVLAGAVTNLDELGVSYADVFTRLLDGDREIPGAIEGSFLVVCYNGTADRWVIVTDKLSARPCFYTQDDGFRFADSLAPLVAQHSNPTVDRQAVSDMLLMGQLWGDRTLVEEISAVRPATILEATNGQVSTQRYWAPTYDEADPSESYRRRELLRKRNGLRPPRDCPSRHAGGVRWPHQRRHRRR